MKPAVVGLFAMSITVFAGADAAAQAVYGGIRAGVGIPTGEFSQAAATTGNEALLRGASPGLGIGLDAGLGSGLVGLYGSYDKIQFDCRAESCAASGKYRLTGLAAGVRVGVPLLPLLKPWAKAGITYNEMKATIGSSQNRTFVSTGKSPGYEVGAGVDIPILMGFFSLTPQVRYVRQKLDIDATGKRPVDYYTFDISLRLRSPI